MGICQLVQHVALDAATKGFIDALNEALPGQVEFENKNASGEVNNCGTIVNGFVSDGVDLIMANATAALTAAASATADIPILGTSITAYGVALDLDDFDGTVGGNISGTSDLARSGEAGCHDYRMVPRGREGGAAVLLRRAQLPLSDRGGRQEPEPIRALRLQEFAFTDSNDVTSVAQSAADYCRRGVHPHRQHGRLQHRGHRQRAGARQRACHLR